MKGNLAVAGAYLWDLRVIRAAVTLAAHLPFLSWWGKFQRMGQRSDRTALA